MEANRILEEVIELFRQLKKLDEDQAVCQTQIKDLTLILIGRLTYERELRRDRPGSYVRGQTDAIIYRIMEEVEKLKLLRRDRLEAYTKIGSDISQLVNIHIQLAMLHIQD